MTTSPLSTTTEYRQSTWNLTELLPDAGEQTLNRAVRRDPRAPSNGSSGTATPSRRR